MGYSQYGSLLTVVVASALATIIGVSTAPRYDWRLLMQDKPDGQRPQASYHDRARRILRDTPLIDGHNDFPILVRQQLHNHIYDYEFDQLALGSQTDFPKMETGMLGGQFWSVFMPCPAPAAGLTEKEMMVQMNEPNVSHVRTYPHTVHA